VRSALYLLEYVALRAVLGAAKRVPLPRLRAVLDLLARIAARLDWRHRQIVLENLHTAFPQRSEAELREALGRAFANWARIGAELAHVDELLARPRGPSYAGLHTTLDRLARRGKGVLVLSAHCANFELLARMAGQPQRETVLFHRPMSNPMVNSFLVRERLRAHVGTLGRGGAVREALRVLSRGGVIVVPMDQNQPPGRGIFVDMFGKPACTSTLLARLSLLTGAPVLPVFAAWRGQDLMATVGEVIEPVAGGDQRVAAAALTARYTEQIEAAVRARPDQWNWAHRRWKTRPEDLPRWLRPTARARTKKVAGAPAAR
jgi:KDO2-lipid IV(A) lauroyltransferase